MFPKQREVSLNHCKDAITGCLFLVGKNYSPTLCVHATVSLGIYAIEHMRVYNFVWDIGEAKKETIHE